MMMRLCKPWIDYSVRKNWIAEFSEPSSPPSARTHRLWRFSFCKDLLQLTALSRMKYAPNSKCVPPVEPFGRCKLRWSSCGLYTPLAFEVPPLHHNPAQP